MSFKISTAYRVYIIYSRKVIKRNRLAEICIASQVLESYPPFLSKVRFHNLKLFQIVMQLQSLVDLSHDLRWELAQLFAQAHFIYRPSLVNHDFGASLQPSRSGRDFNLERIDAGHI
jgi:hypothetical protein